ncbi:hypothetical protein B0T21DRAFT_355757, partial [Apiosordaria backusii]
MRIGARDLFGNLPPATTPGGSNCPIRCTPKHFVFAFARYLGTSHRYEYSVSLTPCDSSNIRSGCANESTAITVPERHAPTLDEAGRILVRVCCHRMNQTHFTLWSVAPLPILAQ